MGKARILFRQSAVAQEFNLAALDLDDLIHILCTFCRQVSFISGICSRIKILVRTRFGTSNCTNSCRIAIHSWHDV